MQRFIAYCFFILILLAVINCAKRGTPSGGEKDITPPKLIRSEPQINSTHFKGKIIKLYFDEYIQLKDLQKQLIVSPPLRYPPEILPQGNASKHIEIRLKDTLRENTTYVFNFGQSIVDNNENNPYPFLKYIFSTGSYIDSLKVTGIITDALQKKEETFVSVMLYKIDSTYTDSTVYKTPPSYIFNTLDSSKVFEITNVKAGKYKLFALKDKDKNNVFNPLQDKIAFLKNIITVPADTTYILTLFKEIPDFKVSRPSLAAKNRIIFGYQGKADSMQIRLLSSTPNNFKYSLIKDIEKDTLHYWFTHFETDSLVFAVKNLSAIDTFSIKLRDLKNDSLQIKSSHSGNIPLNQKFYLQANIPLIKKDSSLVSIINKDSTAIPFKLQLDNLKNTLLADFETIPNQHYSLTFLPGAIEDFFGNINDTLKYSLSTKSLADYGNVHITLNNVRNYPIIVQLTDDKGVVKHELYAPIAQTEFDFRNIEPAKYYIRIIYDTNSNGIWDTGNYLLQQQPEKVIYYPEILDVRANWELEQVFTLSE